MTDEQEQTTERGKVVTVLTTVGSTLLSFYARQQFLAGACVGAAIALLLRALL